MSLCYLVSPRNNATMTDSTSQNLLTDFFVLWGIKEEVSEETDIISKYNKVQDSIEKPGYYHYYSKGVEAIRDICNKSSNKKISGRKIKKMCFTKRRFRVKIPKDAHIIFEKLFESLCPNYYDGVNEVLKECCNRTDKTTHKCENCMYGILSFEYDLLTDLMNQNKQKRSKIIAKKNYDKILNVIKEKKLVSNCTYKKG